LSKTSSTAARDTGLRVPEPLKITSCIDSPRNSEAFRFAQHPAHRIHDIGFAAAIRSNHADELTGQRQRRRIDEGFEAGEFQFGQAHERERELLKPRQRKSAKT
jgi:hypothetical protein